MAVLAFVGSFVVRITQGETAPAENTPAAIVPVNIRVQVLNGCGVNGAASSFAAFVKRSAAPEFVVDVIDQKNFNSTTQERTLLIGRKNDPMEARKLAAKLGLASERISYQALADDFYDLDYSVVVGLDYETIMAGGKAH